jgi:aspartyl-tRNA(Asn)/glutamyl-tRNA(Gln) amidotransferase subunit C
MKLGKKEVEKLAHLARLEFNEEEKAKMIEDMDKIIGFVSKIDEMDLEGVEPQVYMTEGEDILRKDIVKGELKKEEALKNAPQKDTDYIKVPKVVNK